MARNTSISLGDHFAGFVDQQVESGRYGSVSDVIRAGLRLLEDHDRQNIWLRGRMAAAEAQIAADNVHEDHDGFWDELRREVDERLMRDEQPHPDVCP